MTDVQETDPLITSAAVSDRGLSEKRPENEDAYLEMRQSGIFAVADGVGGAQAGEVASQMAMEILGEAFANLPETSDAESVMCAAIERANGAIYQMAHELPQLQSMATTIAAVHIAGNIATIGHVGDSRVYRLDREGTLFRETEDHSMVAEEVRAGRMTEEQADTHPSRNIISRALGAEMTVEPELKTIMVEPGTAFLLCSDGITRHVADDEIRGVLTFGGEPADVCEYLKNVCYERGAEDNLTAVVVRIGTARAPAATDLEETTAAAARAGVSSQPIALDPALLELDTEDLPAPAELDTVPTKHAGAETVRIDIEGSEASAPTVEMARDGDAAFSMFGASVEDTAHDGGSGGGMSRLLTYAGILVIGGLLGFGAYHFAFVRSPAQPGPALDPVTEMQSENVAMTAFEKNRRNVDSDPGGYLSSVPAEPRDAEDAYLLGRAYLLAGDFPHAQSSFKEARRRLAAGEADQANAKILADDIAVGLAVTHDTTIQGILKGELERSNSKPPASTNTNR